MNAIQKPPCKNNYHSFLQREGCDGRSLFCEWCHLTVSEHLLRWREADAVRWAEREYYIEQEMSGW